MRRRPAALTVLLLLLLAVLPGSAAAGGAQGSWCADRSRITVLGGSSSTGYQTTGYVAGGAGTYQPTRHGWWRRVAEQAAGAWGTQATNNSRNGARTDDFLPGGRWPVTAGAVAQIRAEQPSLVILQLGGNEYLAEPQVDPVTYEATLRRLVGDIRAARPGVDLLIIISPRAARPGAVHPWTAYGAAMGRTARTLGAALLDMRQLIDGSDTDTAGVWAADGKHVNDAGQLGYAGAVWSQLVASTC